LSSATASANFKPPPDLASPTSAHISGNIPDLLIDLLEVAAYVYCADQRIARGSAMLTNFGEDWRRSLTFAIPVRHPEVWQRADVQELLLDTLGFLSDDPPDLFQDRQSAATQQPMTNRHTRPRTIRDLAKSLSGTY